MGKTVAEIVKEISDKFNSMCLDLVAYSENGERAALMFDNAQTIEKIYMAISLQKKDKKWNIFSIENYNDVVDMMDSVHSFLNK